MPNQPKSRRKTKPKPAAAGPSRAGKPVGSPIAKKSSLRVKKGATPPPPPAAETPENVDSGPGTRAGTDPASCEPDARWVVGSQAEVARFFGCNRHTVKDWAGADMPRLDGGGYDLREIVKWKLAKAEWAGDGEEADGLKQRLATADVAKAEADAAMKQLKLAEQRGRLVDRDAAKAVNGQIFAAVRNRLEQLPREVAGAVPPEIRDSVVEDVAHRVALCQRELAALKPAADPDAGGGE